MGRAPRPARCACCADGAGPLAAAEEFKTGVSTVLRVTANRGLYPPALAAYLDDVFTGKTFRAVLGISLGIAGEPAR